MDVEGEPPVNIIVKCEQPLSIQIPLEEVEEVWDDWAELSRDRGAPL